MGYEIFYQILDEMRCYDRQEEMTTMWEMVKDYDTKPQDAMKDTLAWAEETLDLMNIPEGPFRKSYVVGLSGYDTLKALTEYIYDNFKPEEDEGEDDSTEAQRERCCHRGPEEPPCERENCECEGQP